MNISPIHFAFCMQPLMSLPACIHSFCLLPLLHFKFTLVSGPLTLFPRTFKLPCRVLCNSHRVGWGSTKYSMSHTSQQPQEGMDMTSWLHNCTPLPWQQTASAGVIPYGQKFGGLLKICHLVEFTLAFKPVLAIMIFTTKSNVLEI